jgi:hypothetical protein
MAAAVPVQASARPAATAETVLQDLLETNLIRNGKAATSPE